jgi:hypothetical protein
MQDGDPLFFQATALLEKKDLVILGWGNAKEAEKLADAAMIS